MSRPKKHNCVLPLESGTRRLNIMSYSVSVIKDRDEAIVHVLDSMSPVSKP